MEEELKKMNKRIDIILEDINKAIELGSDPGDKTKSVAGLNKKGNRTGKNEDKSDTMQEDQKEDKLKEFKRGYTEEEMEDFVYKHFDLRGPVEFFIDEHRMYLETLIHNPTFTDAFEYSHSLPLGPPNSYI